MQWPPPRPLPTSDPSRVMTSTPALRSSVLVNSFRSYPTTTPGSRATTLLPSSHCSRSAWDASPPVPTTVMSFSPSASLIAPRNESSRRMSSSPSASAGRTDYAVIDSTTLGYIVTLSRSRKVNTVSRCMWARSRVMPAAITRSAAPLANSARAIFSII